MRILTWMGNKSEVAQLVLDRLGPVSEWSVYIEPFAGSLAVFEAARDAGYLGPAVIAERDPVIRGFWTVLQQQPDELARALDELPRRMISERTFLHIRNQMNRTLDKSKAEVAASFLWINRMGFNGLHRMNKGGAVNTSYGKRKSWEPPAQDVLDAWTGRLQGVTILANWRECPAHAGEGARVYADPPYVGHHDYGSWYDRTDRVDLARWLAKVPGRVAISEMNNANALADFAAFGEPTVYGTRQRCSRVVSSRGVAFEALWVGGAA